MAIIKKPILIYSRGDTATLERLSKIRAEMRTIPIRGDAKFIFRVAINAERWCESRGLRVKERPGMIVIDTSSKRPFPARYNSKRSVSVIKIVRKTRGWYLVGVSRDEMWQVQQIWTNYYLTPAQDERVKEWLWRQYAVQAEKGGE